MKSAQPVSQHHYELESEFLLRCSSTVCVCYAISSHYDSLSCYRPSSPCFSIFYQSILSFQSSLTGAHAAKRIVRQSPNPSSTACLPPSRTVFLPQTASHPTSDLAEVAYPVGSRFWKTKNWKMVSRVWIKISVVEKLKAQD